MRPSDLGLWYDSYRPGQVEAIYRIATSPTRVTLLEAPTGAGKTVIYISAAKVLGGRTLIVVINKGLQDQLEEFAQIGVVDVRGHGNYSCAQGQAEDFECLNSRGQCEQQQAMSQARKAKIVKTNIALWTTLQSIGGESAEALGTFDNIIVDEAHAVPPMLSDRVGVRFSWRDYRHLLKLNLCESGNHQVQIEWAKRAIAKIDTATAKNIFAKLQLRRMRRDAVRFVVEAEESWVIQMIDGDIFCNPIWPWGATEKYLFAGAKKVILCSAFIPARTPQRLGIAEDEFTKVVMDSPFDPRRSPFYYWPISSVDHRMSGIDLRRWVAAMDEIITQRIGCNGIIHSRSYHYAERIRHQSQANKIMITHGPGGIAEALDRYLSSPPPTVLLTPAVVEGYNFPDDKCRYIITGKVPFADVRQPMNAARNRVDRTWRQEEAMLSVVQSAGRGMRHAGDYCETFMLDRHWEKFRRQADAPEYFKRTWIDVESAPVPLRPD